MRRSIFLYTLIVFACGSPADPGDSGTTSSTAMGVETSGGVPVTTSSAESTSASTTTGGGSSSEGTSTGTSTGAATTAETSTGAASTGAASTGEASTGEASTGGATSPLVIAVVDAELYANCGQGEADPVWGSWYVNFDNTANPDDTAAVVVAASLSLADADPPVPEPILVDPIESGPIAAGEYASQKLQKLPGVAHSACEHCGEFYQLVLEYAEGGVMHHVEEDVTISCQP